MSLKLTKVRVSAEDIGRCYAHFVEFHYGLVSEALDERFDEYINYSRVDWSNNMNHVQVDFDIAQRIKAGAGPYHYAIFKAWYVRRNAKTKI